jgi:hypothetical protein
VFKKKVLSRLFGSEKWLIYTVRSKHHPINETHITNCTCKTRKRDQLGDFGVNGRIILNIIMNLKEIGNEDVYQFKWLILGPVTGSCEHGWKTPGFC